MQLFERGRANVKFYSSHHRGYLREPQTSLHTIDGTERASPHHPCPPDTELLRHKHRLNGQARDFYTTPVHPLVSFRGKNFSRNDRPWDQNQRLKSAELGLRPHMCQGRLLDLAFQYAIISLFSCRLAFTWRWRLFRRGLSLASSSCWLEGVFWAPPIQFTLVDPSVDHETSSNRHADYSSPAFCFEFFVQLLEILKVRRCVRYGLVL